MTSMRAGRCAAPHRASRTLPREYLRHRIAASGDFELREDLLQVKLDGVIRDAHAARDHFNVASNYACVNP
jgi:hypothetical protein